MANRIPLVIDTDNQNKISELPTGDNFCLLYTSDAADD